MAKKLQGDGEDIAQSGSDIKSTWQGLAEVYSAPESGDLLSAINPVATTGEDIESAWDTAGGALLTFAERARELKARLKSLKADAVAFREGIDGDEDWNEDEDKVDENNALSNDVWKAQHDYMEAERECVNKITGIFGGTTFIGAGLSEGTEPGKGEEVYGFEEAPQDVAAAWGGPVEVDHQWWVDAGAGIRDFGAGVAEGVGGLTGVYYDGNWTLPLTADAGENNLAFFEDGLATIGSLTGFYTEDGGLGVGSGSEWWNNFSGAWEELGHSFVPWTEWDNRPGYVITQGVLNIGSLGLSGAGFFKAGKSGSGPHPEQRDVDVEAVRETSGQQQTSGQQPAQGVGEALKSQRENQGEIQDLRQGALDDAAALGERGSGSPTGSSGNTPGSTGTPDQGGNGQSGSDSPNTAPPTGADSTPDGDTSTTGAGDSTSPDADRDGSSTPDDAAPATAGGTDSRTPDESSTSRSEQDPTTEELRPWLELADEIGLERTMELAGIQGGLPTRPRHGRRRSRRLRPRRLRQQCWRRRPQHPQRNDHPHRRLRPLHPTQPRLLTVPGTHRRTRRWHIRHFHHRRQWKFRHRNQFHSQRHRPHYTARGRRRRWWRV
ncbi:hypothetical protein [Allosalinactinospora lopnorensis]|uniref:hypothetical protein n=1 Tax=Allosalinactinospora lopnorensis TaxID=1352348 RepID=UPI000698C25E|nr:hypothetical protein [Allosalinactinospora lopnorensis]